MRRISGRYERTDRGAAAVIFAIMLSSGVLLGLGAIVVDVGQLYAKRQEVLTGADSAALAAAKDCQQSSPCTADGLTSDPSSPTNVAAASSSPDLLADARITCGRKDGAEIRVPCDPVSTNLAGCIGARPATGNYVEVSTTARFRQGTGSTTLLPAPFTQAIMGSKYKGSTLTACARETWGTPTHVTAIGLGFSQCVLTSPRGALTGTPAFSPKPPYDSTFLHLGDVGWRVIQVRYGLLDSLPPWAWIKPDCGQGPGDAGNIAWIGSPQKCYSDFVTGTEVAGIPADTGGAGLKCALDQEFAKVADANQIVLMPVYDTARKNGSTWLYHVVGYVSFYPTSLHLAISASWDWQNLPSTLFKALGCLFYSVLTSTECIMGYFSRTGIHGPVSTTSNTPDFGVDAFNLSG